MFGALSDTEELNPCRCGSCFVAGCTLPSCAPLLGTLCASYLSVELWVGDEGLEDSCISVTSGQVWLKRKDGLLLGALGWAILQHSPKTLVRSTT